MSDVGERPCAHWFRKGNYLGSDADFRCVLCGLEASAASVDRRLAATERAFAERSDRWRAV